MTYRFTLDHDLSAGADTAVFDELAGYAHRYATEQGERWGART